jgi:hypothetical protein
LANGQVDLLEEGHVGVVVRRDTTLKNNVDEGV